MITKLLSFAALSVAIYFLIAIGLILSQWPKALPERAGLDFSTIMQVGGRPPDSDSFRLKTFEARDGTTLSYRHVKAEGAEGAEGVPLILMLHGSGWYHGQFDRLAFALRDVAEVKALTLRGHGRGPDKTGDLRYIGQLEDDIADLIGETEREVVLLGHSSGGGLAVRFAGGAHSGKVDSMILLAPFLNHNAPTTRQNSGGWANALTRRIIGLSMLNAAGIHALDGLAVIQFAMPRAVLAGPQGKHATTRYSWRLNTSYAPRAPYLSDVAALPRFTLIAGRKDEAFVADGYEPLMSSVTRKGVYALVDGVGHLDIVDAPQTEALIREHLRERSRER
jgi:alpha-beta hydrolase superfamily lysophospholipase